MGTQQYLEVSRDPQSRILTLTLSRTDNERNQINTGLIHELREVLEAELESRQARGLLLMSAREKVFSTGADIEGELGSGSAEDAYSISRLGHEVFGLISRLHCVSVALLSGFALGGGLELALCCDFRIAARNARLGLPEINLGLLPGWGGTQRLTRLIGTPKAMRMILGGDPLNAQAALDCGLVDEVVESYGDLRSAGEKLLLTFRDKSPRALAFARNAIVEGRTLPLDTGLELESALFSQAWDTPDREEGLSALREKRRPRWPQ